MSRGLDLVKNVFIVLNGFVYVSVLDFYFVLFKV